MRKEKHKIVSGGGSVKLTKCQGYKCCQLNIHTRI